jgi:acetyl esterase/lipase
MNIERITLNRERNVSLTAYVQQTGGEFRNIKKRPAVLIIPGGGYYLCSDREADPVAFPYLKAGYHAFILRYSVKKAAAWPNPLNDYEQAMELIRSKTEEWNLYEDKIAVIGFSAGGHLAACAATIAKNKPNAAILGYAVLTGDTAQSWLKSAPDVVSAVDKNTCPCFMFASRMDNEVPVKNTLQFLMALDNCGIAFESHIYGYGPHGFSTCDSSVESSEMANRTPNWVADSIEWLKDVFGDFGDGKMTDPRCPKRVKGNEEPFLSIDCTFGYLMKFTEAQKILKPLFEGLQAYKAENVGDDEEGTSEIATHMTIRSMLGFAKTPERVVEQFNAQLKKIPNKDI